MAMWHWWENVLPRNAWPQNIFFATSENPLMNGLCELKFNSWTVPDVFKHTHTHKHTPYRSRNCALCCCPCWNNVPTENTGIDFPPLTSKRKRFCPWQPRAGMWLWCLCICFEVSQNNLVCALVCHYLVVRFLFLSCQLFCTWWDVFFSFLTPKM